jgi:PIN domain
LHELHAKVSNLAGGVVGGSANQWLLAYLDWANEAVRALRLLVSSDDIDRLVVTRRYELLLASAGNLTDTDQQRLLNGLVSVEIDHRMAAFADACAAVDEQIKLWTQLGVFVVADTTVYINHDQKLEELDFAPLIPVREQPIHVLVPIVVVDELDRLKDNNGEVASRVHARCAGPSMRAGKRTSPAARGRLLRAGLRWHSAGRGHHRDRHRLAASPAVADQR